MTRDHFEAAQYKLVQRFGRHTLFLSIMAGLCLDKPVCVANPAMDVPSLSIRSFVEHVTGDAGLSLGSFQIALAGPTCLRGIILDQSIPKEARLLKALESEHRLKQFSARLLLVL